MLSREAKINLLKQTSWSGYVYIACLLIGMGPLAHFLPSQPPTYDPAQIKAVYDSNVTGIRVGMVLALIGSMFYVPWTALLAKAIARIEGGVGILTYSQVIAGCTNVLLTAYPAGWWLLASFRPERNPEIVQLLNDIAWLQFLGVISPFYFVPISIAYASLADSSKDPIFPRWVGWFNIWFMLTLIPLSIIFWFHSGPFAWNGIFGFYLPFIIFFIWFFVMTPVIRKAIPKLDDFDVQAKVK